VAIVIDDRSEDSHRLIGRWWRHFQGGALSVCQLVFLFSTYILRAMKQLNKRAWAPPSADQESYKMAAYALLVSYNEIIRVNKCIFSNVFLPIWHAIRRKHSGRVMQEWLIDSKPFQLTYGHELPVLI
jgi:hypothetical protein